MVVPVETKPTFNAGAPRELFKGTYHSFSNILRLNNTPWDIHPDGDKFLMIKPYEMTEEGSSEEYTAAEEFRKIVVVTNWFEELKEKAPVD